MESDPEILDGLRLWNVIKVVAEVVIWIEIRILIGLPDKAMATLLTPPISFKRSLALDPKIFSK